MNKGKVENILKRGNYDKFTIKVKKILSRNNFNKFTVLEGYVHNKNITKENKFLFKGFFVYLNKNDVFDIEGKWGKDNKNNIVFNIEVSTRILPIDKDDIKNFIKRNVQGIGEKTCEVVVGEFKESTFSVIEEGYEKLEGIGVNKEKALRIHMTLSEMINFERVFNWVQKHGLGYNEAKVLFNNFNKDSIIKIKENPYCLSTINKLGFVKSDILAKSIGFSFCSMERIRQSVIYILEYDTRLNGSLYMLKDYLYNNLNGFILKKGMYKQKNKIIDIHLIDEAIQSLVIDEKIICENNNGIIYIYLKKYYELETNIARILKKITNNKYISIIDEDKITEYISNFERLESINLACNQKLAVHMAINERISILTGSPGTGKTFILNVIIKCIKELNPDATIEVAAPTGRAAKRITEMTKIQAKTIHRLINLKVNLEEVNDRTNIINSDYLIIDESSMIDVNLFYELIKSIGEQTKILFVGDYDQLPSVGPGLIFRDLINSNLIKIVKLDETIRQNSDSSIYINSKKIIKGEHKGIIINDTSRNDFYFFKEKNIDNIKRLLFKKINGLTTKMNFSLKDIQVILPVKVGELGTIAINRILQEIFNPKQDSMDSMEIILDNKILRVGDRVIQNKNNYRLNIFNGEIGYIIQIRNTNKYEIVVQYGDRQIIYDEDSFDNLELAYALTVHKSQGSEFKVVVALMHEEYLKINMPHRNILYTIITRAKEMVVLIGSDNAFLFSIKNECRIERNSLLIARLQNQI